MIKIAVTGSAGQIGYALLFRIASGEMFGKQTKIQLNLLELESAMGALEGVKKELDDCAFSLIEKIIITSDPNKAFEDIDWALLVGSVPRKQGMERNDLLEINANVFVEQAKALSNLAKNTCKVLVVGNPCNTNAYIVKSIAKNIPVKNFFAMTMLDQNRAVAQIAQKAAVKIENIKNIIIWGNHSATQYPDISYMIIKDELVKEVIKDEKWLKEDFIKIVQQRGSEIIKARGLSSAASAANAIIDTVKALRTKTSDNEYFSVAVSSDGSYGIEEGLMFSFPIQCDGENWKIVQNLEINSFSRDKIEKTYEELLMEKEYVIKIINNKEEKSE